MATYGVFFFGVMLAGHARIEAALSKEWQAFAIKMLYWIMPKTAELTRSAAGGWSPCGRWPAPGP